GGDSPRLGREGAVSPARATTWRVTRQRTRVRAVVEWWASHHICEIAVAYTTHGGDKAPAGGLAVVPVDNRAGDRSCTACRGPSRPSPAPGRPGAPRLRRRP